MDRSDKSTSQDDKPGAPALNSSVKVPKPDTDQEAPTETTVKEAADAEPQPAFQPNPTYRGVEAPPVKNTFTANDHKKRTEYLKEVRQSRAKKSHFWRNFFVILIVLLAAGAAGAWFVWQPSPASQQNTGQATPSAQQPAPQTDTLGPNEVEMKNYSASSLPLSLEYPASWTVDEQNGVLTITSPVTELTAASGNQASGKMVLTVENSKDAKLPAFDNGSVVAVLASERFRYAQPAPAQQGTTYVSFLQYPNTTTQGGMDAIYITGNAGYVYAGTVAEADLRAVEPLIGLTFISCGNSDCPAKTQEPLAISSDMWSQESFKKPLTDMFKSFRITS